MNRRLRLMAGAACVALLVGVTGWSDDQFAGRQKTLRLSAVGPERPQGI